jgi:putative MFS transporter
LLLVPYAPLGIEGWRWVVLIGAAGAIFVWWIRLRVPESPRWLANHGRGDEAAHIVAGLEARVAAEWRGPLPSPAPPEPQLTDGRFSEIWRPPYLSRTVMMSVFNVFQAIGFYGFANWVPTLLISQGIAVTSSLQYTFVIAMTAPFGPLLGAFLADRFERKWMIVTAALSVAVFGILFGQMDAAPALIFFGVLVTLASNSMSFLYHSYQTELFPTRIRTRAVGFVYSWSRLSNVFSAFVVAFILGEFGAPGVFAFIAACMAIAASAIALLGPATSNRALEAISR